MSQNFHLDSLDKRILHYLTKDARMPFLEVARNCKVSGAAIHQRVQKMVEAGVISGTQFTISPKGAGFHTCAFIGIQVNLTSTSTHEQVFQKIKQSKEAFCGTFWLICTFCAYFSEIFIIFCTFLGVWQRFCRIF